MATLYQVDITQIPADMIGMTKALRVIGKMPLRKARDVASGSPDPAEEPSLQAWSCPSRNRSCTGSSARTWRHRSMKVRSNRRSAPTRLRRPLSMGQP